MQFTDTFVPVLFERRVRLTAAWVVVIGLTTLAPFSFAPGDRRPLLLFDRYQQDPIDFVANVLLFVPLGALLRKSSTGQRSIAACMAAGGLLSLMDEERRRTDLRSNRPVTPRLICQRTLERGCSNQSKSGHDQKMLESVRIR